MWDNPYSRPAHPRRVIIKDDKITNPFLLIS